MGLKLKGLHNNCFDVNSQKSKKIPIMESYFSCRLLGIRSWIFSLEFYGTFQDSYAHSKNFKFACRLGGGGMVGVMFELP